MNLLLFPVFITVLELKLNNDYELKMRTFSLNSRVRMDLAFDCKYPGLKRKVWIFNSYLLFTAKITITNVIKNNDKNV